jgi:hypothetical protein
MKPMTSSKPAYLQGPGFEAWKPAIQPEIDHRACQRIVRHAGADDTELALCRAAELRHEGQPGPMPDRLRRALPVTTKADYGRVALRNLHQLSRTARGVLDVSASPDKAAAMVTLSAEDARLATHLSLKLAVEQMHRARWTVFASPVELRGFVEGLARTVTAGVLRNGHLVRSHDSDKYPYTLVKHLDAAMTQFYAELHARMARSESPRTLAPWVEYRMNLADHFFSDGCGKVSQLVAGFVCMRMGHPMPLYRTRDDYFEGLGGRQRRGLDPKADELALQRFTAHYQQFFMPHDVFDKVGPGEVDNALKLLKQRDPRPLMESDSGTTYELRRRLLARGPEGRLEEIIPSFVAHTYAPPADAASSGGTGRKQSSARLKAYISDARNWVPERRSLQERAYQQVRRAVLDLHERIEALRKPGAKPVLMMMRGNSGVGKTHFLNHHASRALPVLGLPAGQHIGAGAISPDVFKAHFRQLVPGEFTWSRQVHGEASMLARRLIDEMRASGRNFIVDKRLATLADVAGVTGPRGAPGHLKVLVDLDAPLQVSLEACRCRDDQGTDARPPQRVVEEGFRAMRSNRGEVAGSDLLDAYYAFCRVPDPQGGQEMVAVARRDAGTGTVQPLPGRLELWRGMTSPGNGAPPRAGPHTQ